VSRGYLGAVTGNVRRAAAFAVVGGLSLLAPVVAGRVSTTVLTAVTTVPFVAVAVGALYLVDGGRLFDLFARPGDYEERRLYGLAGFAMAAAGLGLLATAFGLPVGVFVASVLLLAVGSLAQAAARGAGAGPFPATAAFTGGAFLAGSGAALAVTLLEGGRPDVALAAFLGATGALSAALLRSVLFERDDPLVMVSTALLLWGLVELGVAAGTTQVAVGVVVTVGFGIVAYALGTASIQGMLTGVLLALFAIVLGGYGWFALLITFFGLGGLSTKYRYEEKLDRDIAEENDGARGSGNVLANAAVGLVAVLAFAASDAAGLPPELFRLAFAGSVATAMADTLSSELGGLYDDPRLVTTLRPVPPGTDGAITLQGEVAGLVGAGIIAGIAAIFFGLGPLPTLLVVAAGFVGMTVDSLLGATLEGGRLGNGGVNLLATLAGAVTAAALALPLVWP
jgi:uncharacterized protein (TIGR00297 family)